VPTLTGVGGDIGPDMAGQDAIVDGDLGFLVTGPDEAARRYYQMERRRIDGRKAALSRQAAAPGRLRDGRKLEVAANIASPDDGTAAFAAGAKASASSAPRYSSVIAPPRLPRRNNTSPTAACWNPLTGNPSSSARSTSAVTSRPSI
jgi:hypothetical protein